MSEAFPKPFPQSYWVIPGILCVGPYPSGLSVEEKYDKARAIIEHRFRTIINLTAPGELSASGEPFFDYKTLIEKTNFRSGLIHFEQHGWPDAEAPPLNTLLHVTQLVDANARAGRKTYLHCYGGHGRSGTVIAAWLILKGKTYDEAIQMINDFRADLPKSHPPFEQSQLDLLKEIWDVVKERKAKEYEA